MPWLASNLCLFGLPSMRPLLASASLLLGRRCSLLVRHVMRHAPCMQARLRAPLPGGARGARPLPSIGRAELCASAPASTACGQAASSGQKATRNSAEQIEKERLLGHISALKSQAVPLLLSALLGCYAGSCQKQLASSHPTLPHDPSCFNT